MNNLGNKSSANLYIANDDEKDLKILSLLLKVFENSADDVFSQAIKHYGLMRKMIEKYGDDFVVVSYANALNKLDTCMTPSYDRGGKIIAMDPARRFEKNETDSIEATIGWDDWKLVAKGFISSLEKPSDLKDNNIGIYWLLKVIEQAMRFCPKGITIGIEYQYVDRIYRDSYYMHLGEEHFNKSRFCSRIVIFNGNNISTMRNISKMSISILQNNYIGSIVIRPIKNNSIGRCLLNPNFFRPSREEKIYVRVSKYKINYNGIPLVVDAFPYEMQDGITTTCAEVTLLNIADYYSNQFQDYKFMLPSTINNIIEKFCIDRIKPAHGLSYELMSKILYEAGFAPKFYHNLSEISGIEIMQILSFYIESGIPVAVGLNRRNGEKGGHSVVCIGHGDVSNSRIKDFVNENTPQNNELNYFENGDIRLNPMQKQTIIFKRGTYRELHRTFSFTAVEKYIIQDDLRRPYIHVTPYIETEEIGNQLYKANQLIVRYGEDDEYLAKCFIAPLYKRMYMDAITARDAIDEILLSELGPRKKGQTKENCIVVRLFLASARNLKEHRVMTTQSTAVKKLYQRTHFPQFVWVAELYDIEKYPNTNAFGEIILDATNAEDASSDSIIMINYRSRHLARDRDGVNIAFGNINDEGEFDFVVFKCEEWCTYVPYTCNLRQFPKKNG